MGFELTTIIQSRRPLLQARRINIIINIYYESTEFFLKWEAFQLYWWLQQINEHCIVYVISTTVVSQTIHFNFYIFCAFSGPRVYVTHTKWFALTCNERGIPLASDNHSRPILQVDCWFDSSCKTDSGGPFRFIVQEKCHIYWKWVVAEFTLVVEMPLIHMDDPIGCRNATHTHGWSYWLYIFMYLFRRYWLEIRIKSEFVIPFIHTVSSMNKCSTVNFYNHTICW